MADNDRMQHSENNKMQQFDFKKIIGVVRDFFKKVADKLKQMDRRLLIMIGAAVLLFLLIVILIAHGISSSVGEEKPSAEPDTVNENPITYQQPAADTQSSQNDIYVVTTGSETPLNMRDNIDGDDVLTTIPNGTQLEVQFVFEYNGYEWACVEYGGDTGWVRLDLLTKQ